MILYLLEYLRFETLSTPGSGVATGHSHMLVGVWNGTATQENSVAVSYKVKLTSTIQSTNPTMRYLPKEDGGVVHTKLCTHMFMSFIDN